VYTFAGSATGLQGVRNETESATTLPFSSESCSWKRRNWNVSHKSFWKGAAFSRAATSQKRRGLQCVR